MLERISNNKENSFYNINKEKNELKKESEIEQIKLISKLNNLKDESENHQGESQINYNSNYVKNKEINKNKNENQNNEEKENELFFSNILNNIELNDICQNINQKKENDNKKYINEDNYIPFTGNPIEFMTDQDNINKNIIIFEHEKMKYSGNYFNNINLDKYYFVISKHTLDLNKRTNFSFKIYPPFSENNNKKQTLPFVAFGLFNYEDDISSNFELLNLPEKHFFCLDLNAVFYTLGKIIYTSEGVGSLNTNGYITLSYVPDKKSLIIKDNFDYNVTITNLKGINNYSNLRICFVFKGENRAIIEYNY